MAKNVNKIAEALGATVVGEVPDTGGGAFGMSRLAAILRTRLEPGQGRRPGRPSDPLWVIQRKVPMSQETLERLDAACRVNQHGGAQGEPDAGGGPAS